MRKLRYFVAVAEERHIGRAAARLHITQPPLSRAIHRLEADLGAALFHRIPSGVELTEAGAILYADARSLLEQADRTEARVRAAVGPATLTVGSLADTAELVAGRIAAAFRRLRPDVSVHVHESDLTDPSAGLRAGLVDVALTRLPFQDAGLRNHVLHAEPVGLVVRDDDPLAARPAVQLADLPDRRWVQLPTGTDPVWRAYWTGAPDGDGHGAPMRTVQECLQAVLWSGMSALAPLDQVVPAGLVIVPVTDRPPSRLVVAWPAAGSSPLVRSFVRIAAETYRRAGTRGD
nr:LysR substrate-binding domain-containing protein [Actinomadura rayongensis]